MAEQVRAELAKGTNPFAVAATIDLPQYAGLAQYDNWFNLNVQAAVVTEVMAEDSWDEAVMLYIYTGAGPHQLEGHGPHRLPAPSHPPRCWLSLLHPE